MMMPRSSRPSLVVALITILGVSIHLFWNHKRAEEREQQASAVKVEQLQAAVLGMASRWNAVTDWQHAFKGRLSSQLFTADFERSVLNQRPILLYASLDDDIKSVEGSYRADLSSLVTQWPLKVRYSLLCDPALAQRFMGEKRGHWLRVMGAKIPLRNPISSRRALRKT